MRLLTAGTMYPPHHQGGYEAVWRSFVLHARAAGHEVAVLTTDHREPAAEGAPEDPGVARELRWWWRDHDFPALPVRERLAVARHDARVLRRALEPRPDAVVWFALGGLPLGLVTLAARHGVPGVGVVHDAWPAYAPVIDRWTGTRLGRALAPLAGLPGTFDPADVAAWSCNSAWTRDAVLAQPGWEAVAGRVRVDHPGIDPARFAPRPGEGGLVEEDHRTAGGPAAARPTAGGPAAADGPAATSGPATADGPAATTGPAAAGEPATARPLRLAVVGRVEPRKGVADAVRALALLPDARLVVTGAGDDAHVAELRALATELGVADRLDLAGPTGDPAGAYAAADVVLFPVTWDEPFGLVPLEAMAVGRPVVATATGGAREFLRDGENALVVAPGDPDGLAAAVRRLAQDGALRQRLRAGGAATAARFTQAACDAALLDLVAEVAARRAP